ncbi:MAG: thioredoxin family protein [Calditrichaeota bacterium]|nr:thioredoxin family protein [Calditrichota bacterium]
MFKNLIFFSLLLFIPLQSYQPVKEFDPNRDPGKDLKEAVAFAQKTDKRIILDVGGNWCIWCRRMDKFIETNADLKSFIEENFIWMKVYYGKENRNERFLSRFPKISGYPHLFVLESDGSFLYSQNTALLEKDKSYDKTKFFTFLKQWIKKGEKP